MTTGMNSSLGSERRRKLSMNQNPFTVKENIDKFDNQNINFRNKQTQDRL